MFFSIDKPILINNHLNFDELGCTNHNDANVLTSAFKANADVASLRLPKIFNKLGNGN